MKRIWSAFAMGIGTALSFACLVPPPGEIPRWFHWGTLGVCAIGFLCLNVAVTAKMRS